MRKEIVSSPDQPANYANRREKIRKRHRRNLFPEKWKWSQQNRIDDAEDGAVHANAQSERNDRHRTESRTLAQHSKGTSQIAQHIILHRQLFRAEGLDGIDHCSSTCGKHACEQRSKPEDRHRRCQQNRIVSGRLIKLRCDQTAERQGRGQSHH
jgi:hypothetical protein